MAAEVRLGQTVIYLEDKREKITTRLGCLSVGERYQDFIGDPFMVPVWDCCLCKTAPEVLRKKNGKWLYRCSGCGKEVVGKEKWQGILRWNRKNCFGKTLAEIPFPALQQESSPQSVVDYLDEYFSLKKKEVGLTRQIAQLTGKRPPGKVYQKRVEAFYEWAEL